MNINVLDWIVPNHEVIFLVQIQAKKVRKKEQRVLVAKNPRVRVQFTCPEVVVWDTKDKQSSVQNVNRDEEKSNAEFSFCCVVFAGESYHYSHYKPYCPLWNSVLKEAISKVSSSEAVCAFRDHLGNVKSKINMPFNCATGDLYRILSTYNRNTSN